ncbi:MAG: hypothetical protein II304_08910 [Bacteroidales bacterium]|nr:hypothetical protein [Bacteroidales bacterium]
MKVYKGYALKYYPKCKQYPMHDNRYETKKARPYDSAEYYWAYTYDKKHWCVVYNKKRVNNNFAGTFEEVVDFIEEKNKNIKQKIIHW